MYLIGTKHVLVKDFACNLVDERVGDPGTVVAIRDLAELVGTDLLHSYFVCFEVIFDRNLRRHSTHSGDFASEDWVSKPSNRNVTLQCHL